MATGMAVEVDGMATGMATGIETGTVEKEGVMEEGVKVKAKAIEVAVVIGTLFNFSEFA